MVAIRGYGAYVPLYRIERASIAEQHGDPPGGGEVAVPAHDESVLTMAVSALKEALASVDVGNGDDGTDRDGVGRVDGSSLDAVYVATTSDPFDDRGVAPHVVRAVGAPSEARVADFQGSARATTNALLAARDAVAAGTADRVAVVASDVLHADTGSSAERTAGAGAGALVIGSDGGGDDANDGVVASLDGTATNTTGFVGRFERSDSEPTPGDARFNRARYVEGVAGAVESLTASVSGPLNPAHAVLTAPDARWGSRALRATDLDVGDSDTDGVVSTFDAVGYAGAASTLLDTSLALERAGPDEQILVVGAGSGGCDALSFTTGGGIERRPTTTLQEYMESKEYVTYAKHREYRERAGGAV